MSIDIVVIFVCVCVWTNVYYVVSNIYIYEQLDSLNQK